MDDDFAAVLAVVAGCMRMATRPVSELSEFEANFGAGRSDTRKYVGPSKLPFFLEFIIMLI